MATPPWLQPIEYRDDRFDTRPQASDADTAAFVPDDDEPATPRPAGRPPGGSRNAEPIDYARGPHERPFGVEDDDETA